MTAIHPLPLILATGSKSRIRVLAQTGLEFTAKKTHLHEAAVTAGTPIKRVVAVAKAKADTAASMIDAPALIVAADTVVIHNNKILEKPKFKMTAVSMLKDLSASLHTVLTGWVVYNSYKNVWHQGHSETYVTFRELGYQEIVNYVNMHPVTSWAGGYNPGLSSAIEFITKIDGSLTGLNGLPLDQIVPVLRHEWAHPYKKRIAV